MLEHLGQMLGMAGYHELRFEDLVVDSKATIGSVLRFLDLPDDEAVDGFSSLRSLRASVSAFQPGQPGSIGPQAWNRRLDEEQVSAVEAELEPLMAQFGYERSNAGPDVDV